MPELSLYELEMERAELLPARETLETILFASPVINITTNIAVAMSAGNFNLARIGSNAAVNSLQATHVH